MGNRSITYFYDGNDFSVGVYTQWNGGQIFSWLKKANLRMHSSDGSAARFTAVCCKKIPGNMSVYLFNPPSEEQKKDMLALMDNPQNTRAAHDVGLCGPGDNGTYIVDIQNKKNEGVKVWQCSSYFEGKDITTYLDDPVCKFLGFIKSIPDNYGGKPPRIKRTKVESASINSFAITTGGHLLIEFKNKSVYRYYNIDAFTAKRFIEADSKGKFFNAYIKENFTTKHLTTIPASFKEGL